MVDLLVLFEQVQELPLDDLEQLHEFMASRPFKVEQRPPTPAEMREVVDVLENLINQPRSSASDDDPATRLMDEINRLNLDLG